MPALRVPFVTNESINYLVKMKNDTSHFHSLEVGKYFNFIEGGRSDPFLINTSLN